MGRKRRCRELRVLKEETRQGAGKKEERKRDRDSKGAVSRAEEHESRRDAHRKRQREWESETHNRKREEVGKRKQERVVFFRKSESERERTVRETAREATRREAMDRACVRVCVGRECREYARHRTTEGDETVGRCDSGIETKGRKQRDGGKLHDVRAAALNSTCAPSVCIVLEGEAQEKR